MINLLPPEEKQRLLYKKKEKLAIIAGIAALVFLVCLILILLFINFYILSEVDYQENILAQSEQSNKMPDFKNLNDVIKKYNEVLNQLDSFNEKEMYFTRVLEAIINVSTPKGVYLSDLSLSRDPKTSVVIAKASGTSGTRDSLLVFKQNIEASKGIKNVHFSPESWINQKGANFSLDFEIDNSINNGTK